MKNLLLFAFFAPHLIFTMSLHDACSQNNVVQVQQILQENPDAVFEADRAGSLPIHSAACSGSSEVLQLLLDAKPDLINATDTNGNIPFIYLFIGISYWRNEVKRCRMLEHLVQMGILRQVGPSVGPSIEEEITNKFRSYKKSIDLFIARDANLELANVRGKKWTDIPVLDKELSVYAHELLQKKLNKNT